MAKAFINSWNGVLIQLVREGKAPEGHFQHAGSDNRGMTCNIQQRQLLVETGGLIDGDLWGERRRRERGREPDKVTESRESPSISAC